MKLEELKNIGGALLGVDFGDVRTGLAVCDKFRTIATGRGFIKESGIEKTAEKVAEYAKSEKVVGIVIGVPVNMDGSEGHRAERARRFASLVEEASGLPVATIDERMTTMAAARYLNETDTRGKKRKEAIDALSAEIILQNALDKMKNMN